MSFPGSSSGMRWRRRAPDAPAFAAVRRKRGGQEEGRPAGDAANGAPHGAERTASLACASGESRIACGMAGAPAHAHTVGVFAAAGPAGRESGQAVIANWGQLGGPPVEYRPHRARSGHRGE